MRRVLKLVAMAVVVLLGSGSALAELPCDYGMQSTLACMIPCCPAERAPAVPRTQSHAIPVTVVTALASMGCNESDCVAASPQVQGMIQLSSSRHLRQMPSAISWVIIPFAASAEVQPRAFNQPTRAHAPELLVTLQVFRI
jgi:hypothetical protein